MKKIISLLLAAVLLAFLCLTNPTTEDFAEWYAEEAEAILDVNSSIVEDLLTNLTGQLATRADRDNYMICSVFTYQEHTTLGIGMVFIPMDSLGEQLADLRESYADWLDDAIG